LTTDRSVFTEAYVVVPRGSLTDIVTSFLPSWRLTRLWVLARPLSGFAETFSQYIVEVSPGGGSDQPETDPAAEAVLFVMTGSLLLTIDGDDHLLGPGGYAFLPPGCPWTAHQQGPDPVTFHWVRKAYERVDGIDLPEPFVVNEHDVEPIEMPDTDGVWTIQRTCAMTCTSTS
jgi:(S)-ureidoglycine aminohydrolase